MLVAKLENKLDADQTIIEGVWMSCFGFFVVMGIEAYTVRSIGWENANYGNLILSLFFILVAVAIKKKNVTLASIGYALPLIHLGLNLDILIGMFDALIFYFVFNAIRALKMYESLPEGPKEETLTQS